MGDHTHEEAIILIVMLQTLFLDYLLFVLVIFSMGSPGVRNRQIESLG